MTDPEAEARSKRNTGRWAAAAGMGIGSAALVAALLYANRSKATKPLKPPAPPES